MRSFSFKIALISTILTLLVLVSMLGSYSSVSGASSNEFAQANTAIENAYTELYYAQVQNHGNVSKLVDQLNLATQLVDRARAENSTNPTQATSDLLNAESIAQQVSNETKAVSSRGIAVYKFQTYESIGATLSVIAAAGLVYASSEFLYRRWWTLTYRNYSVRLKKRIAKQQ